jgi:hypothetical protein
VRAGNQEVSVAEFLVSTASDDETKLIIREALGELPKDNRIYDDLGYAFDMIVRTCFVDKSKSAEEKYKEILDVGCGPLNEVAMRKATEATLTSVREFVSYAAQIDSLLTKNSTEMLSMVLPKLLDSIKSYPSGTVEPLADLRRRTIFGLFSGISAAVKESAAAVIRRS